MNILNRIFKFNLDGQWTAHYFLVYMVKGIQASRRYDKVYYKWLKQYLGEKN